MSEVSTRALSLWFLWLERQGIDPDRLVEGTALTLRELREPLRRIRWDDFAELAERFEALVGGAEALREVGHVFFESPMLDGTASIAGLVSHPRQLYDLACRFVGNSLFTVLESSFEVLSRDRCRMVLRIPEGFADCPPFFRITQGTLEKMPGLLGYPEAQVDMALRRREAIYDIFTPPRPGVLALDNLRRVARVLREPQGLIEEIARQHEELRNSLLEAGRTKAALAESEARWRGLVERAPDTILWLDTEGRIRFVNRTSYRPKSDYLGVHITELGDADTREAFELVLRDVLENGSVRTFESHWTPRGHQARYYSNRLGPIVREGRVTGVIVIARDVTDERRAEAERRELERRVLNAERFESLGVLAGGIAHDFNNLLSVIVGNADLAAEDVPSGSPARESLEHVQTAARRASELTTQLLAYAGRWQPVTQHIDLSERIRSVGELLRSAVPHSIDFVVHLPSELPLVDADPVQIQQVVMNLIANAVEAIGDRAGTIDVRVERTRVDGETTFANVLGPPPEPGQYVLIEVADDGCGMAGDVHERIFEPFYTTKENGHGLGLAAVLGIVRRHEGALEVASAPREGTAFRLLLPTAERVEAPLGTLRRAAVGSEFRGRGTVLVVDDEELVRKTAKRLLEHLGFEVVTAGDGPEALARFDERVDDFVLGLIDLVMPGMSGVELCRRLRDRDPQARLVLSSAHEPPAPDPDDPSGQPDAFLRKPYGPRELAEMLRRVLPADSVGSA